MDELKINLGSIKEAHHKREAAFVNQIAVEAKRNTFAAGLLVHQVVYQAERILRFETSCLPDNENLKIEIQNYVRDRKMAEKVLGTLFKHWYERQRITQNEVNRRSLDNSNGESYRFIIPKIFNADGTHEPIGPRDYPWAQFDSPVCTDTKNHAKKKKTKKKRT